jgi:hypothetical protein
MRIGADPEPSGQFFFNPLMYNAYGKCFFQAALFQKAKVIHAKGKFGNFAKRGARPVFCRTQTEK